MSLDEGISELIGRIYEGAHDMILWQDLLEDVLACLGARSLVHTISDLHRADMQRVFVVGDAKRPQAIDDYCDAMFASDPSFLWAVENPHARYCNTQDILPRSSYLDNEYVRWNRDELIGSTHWMVGYTSPDDELTFGLSVHPYAEAGPLLHTQQQLFRMLFEHMERAARLAARPPRLLAGDEAVIVLDAVGTARDISPAAEDILTAGDGLWVSGGHVGVADRRAAAMFQQAIRSASMALSEGSFGGAVVVPRPSGKRPYVLTTAPLPRSAGPFAAFAPAMVVRIIDGQSLAQPKACSRWVSAFGLTSREVEVAEGLLANHSIETLAEQLGITRNTVRNHLAALFHKTNTTRQVELVRLLSEVAKP